MRAVGLFTGSEGAERETASNRQKRRQSEGSHAGKESQGREVRTGDDGGTAVEGGTELQAPYAVAEGILTLLFYSKGDWSFGTV